MKLILSKPPVLREIPLSKVTLLFIFALVLMLISTLIVDQIVSYHNKFAIIVLSGLIIYSVFSNAIFTKFKKIQKTFN